MNVKAVIETLGGSSLHWYNEFNKLYSSPQAQNQQIWYSIQWRTHYSQIMIHKNCICQFSSKHAAVGCWKWTSGCCIVVKWSFSTWEWYCITIHKVIIITLIIVARGIAELSKCCCHTCCCGAAEAVLVLSLYWRTNFNYSTVAGRQEEIAVSIQCSRLKFGPYCVWTMTQFLNFFAFVPHHGRFKVKQSKFDLKFRVSSLIQRI